MTALNLSTMLILYHGKNLSTNYTIQCLFDVTILLRYIGTLTVILGCIGNFLSIIIFSRKTLRSRSCSMYLLFLSMSDICVLLGYTIESILYQAYGIQLLSNEFMCKTIIFLIYASTDISNYLLTLAAVDRCVLISSRTAHYRFCSKSRAKILIIFVVSFFSLINSHFLYGFRIDQYGLCLPLSNEYSNFYVHHYDSYIDIIKSVLIPFFIIFICNTIIIMKLTRKQNVISKLIYTRRGQRRQEKDRQLTGFLLLTSVLFILLALPSEINDFLRTYLTEEFQRKYACQLWINMVLLILLHQINHASHFYVYTLTGSIFRNELKKIFLTQHRDHYRRTLKQQAATYHHSKSENINTRRFCSFLRQSRSLSRLNSRSDF